MVTNTAEDDPAAQYLDVLPTSIEVMSSTIIQLAKERLAKCQEEHKFCPPANMPFLPKRVLDVGMGQSNLSVGIHVSEPNEQAFYVALSYCWGGPQDITTTSATLQSYTKSLPTGLPRTIQDAILVTRSLGFRYLWVDALCIIQDDMSDKSAEINEMGMIYKSATLTIAAASASTVNDGFLQDRPPLPMCRLPFYMADEKEGSIWLRNSDQVHTKEPLDLRAWTLQESLLSPRILYYAAKDLIWKCHTEQFVPVQETHNPYYTVSTERLPRRIFGQTQTAGAASQSKTWKRIIQDYSRRELTVSEDRLPALAGLAGELHSFWMDKYVAGMWQRCLLKHLGWWRFSSANKEPLTTYKSPTWSWASHDGQVFISDVHHEEAELLDVAVTLVDKNSTFGPVSSGRVVVRAPVLPGDIETELGRWAMDYDPCGLNMVNADTRILLLGYSAAKIPIGLILSPLGDGTFVRIGMVIGWNLKGAAPWSTDMVKQETIIII